MGVQKKSFNFWNMSDYSKFLVEWWLLNTLVTAIPSPISQFPYRTFQLSTRKSNPGCRRWLRSEAKRRWLEKLRTTRAAFMVIAKVNSHFTRGKLKVFSGTIGKDGFLFKSRSQTFIYTELWKPKTSRSIRACNSVLRRLPVLDLESFKITYLGYLGFFSSLKIEVYLTILWKSFNNHLLYTFEFQWGKYQARYTHYTVLLESLFSHLLRSPFNYTSTLWACQLFTICQEMPCCRYSWVDTMPVTARCCSSNHATLQIREFLSCKNLENSFPCQKSATFFQKNALFGTKKSFSVFRNVTAAYTCNAFQKIIFFLYFLRQTLRTYLVRIFTSFETHSFWL